MEVSSNIVLLIDVVGICLAIAVTFVIYFKWSFMHWRKRNLQYLEPTIPFGNLVNLFGNIETIGVTVKRIYDGMKSKNWKHGGAFFFARPIYVVIDLDYVKNVLARDFQHFIDRGAYVNEKDDPIGAHLFAIGGAKWRNLRVKLTPTFTSGKMKMMFPILLDCQTNLQNEISIFHDNKQPVEIKSVLGNFTTDVIGSCAFGLECNSFGSDHSPFRIYGKKFFDQTRFRRFLTVLSVNFPDLGKCLHIRQVPKDISDFFFDVVKSTVEYREKNRCVRNDFMQLLIDMKNNKLVEEEGFKHDGKTLTMDEITAQSFVFFFAGFETSSTTMTFALYELAKNHNIQQKVRDEINAVLSRHDGKVTYESIQEMKYMDQVINETLRKYPPVPFITRECVQDYKVLGEDVIIEKGTRVVIPIYAIHLDEEYYPDPTTFDPDRFSEENSYSRHQYAHIPFGEGPRICIGMRFGLMQSKVGLTSLLREYNFTVNKKTKEPLKFRPNSFVLTAEGGIWLNIQKLFG